MPQAACGALCPWHLNELRKASLMFAVYSPPWAGGQSVSQSEWPPGSGAPGGHHLPGRFPSWGGGAGATWQPRGELNVCRLFGALGPGSISQSEWPPGSGAPGGHHLLGPSLRGGSSLINHYLSGTNGLACRRSDWR
jgi:hypothetical protein